MRNYEALVIVDPALEESSLKQAVDKFTAVIGEKGELGKVDHWGRKRLAFEINHQSEGYYVLANFKAEPSLISELDRLFEIGEEYIRAKIVRMP